ncbi:probable lactoylglutathione lyase, chloroplastic [Asparagus officinalis]|uniref:probable lactoylglutathione lyase, chloroplastic n=1 Tax=Asparagus officinalis TaxID=4686 RepID=UPI00098E7B3B|nr:probable lactoylglutathione lyase, chloroplastic [Asparagus officinalis]
MTSSKTVIQLVEDFIDFRLQPTITVLTAQVLTAQVKSVEDYGYILHFGVPSFTGFLPRNGQVYIAMMGYGPEDRSAVLELTYNYGVKEYDKDNAYAQISRLN